MLVFGKKSRKKQERDIPVGIVRSLASKGMSEPEIVAVLRKHGYSPYELERAISMALKSTVTGNPAQVVEQPAQVQPAQKMPRPPPQRTVPQHIPHQIRQYPVEPIQEQQQIPVPQEYQQTKIEVDVPEFPTMPLPPRREEPESLFTFEKSPFSTTKQEKPEESEETVKIEETEPHMPDITLEEVIEGIVADKWANFEDTIERLRRRDDELQKQIIDIRKEIDALKDAMRKSEESFMTKLEEHSNQVANIEAKIGSIEKVFKEFLPELTESMRLITEALEKKKGG